MKKLIFMLSLMILLTSFSALAAEPSLPDFGEAESFGRGVWTTVTQGSAVCYDANGDAILCYGVQGGRFCAIEVESGEVILDEGLVATQLGSMVTASDGCVYFNAYSQNGLTKYDPIKNEISEVKNSGFNRNGGTIRSSFADDEGKVYFGSYHSDGGVVYIYDTVTNTTEVTEVVKEGATYVQGICADEKNIYAGTGIHPYAAIVRIDKETGEKSEFALNEVKVFNDMRIVGNCLVAKVNGGIYVYDLTTLKRITNQGTGTVSSESPLKENVIYYASQYSGSIYEYDVNTHKSTKVLNTPISEWETIGITGLNWTLKDDEWVLEYHSSRMKYVGYYNPVTKENVLNETSKMADTGPQIQSLEISPDNVIYMGGYQNGMSAYDIDKGEFIYRLDNWSQNEGAGFLNGKVYFGVYTDARVWCYDPEKPWNYSLYNGDGKYQGADANPAMVYDIDDGQDRPFVVKGYNNKLYVGTMCGYGKLGGALTIYEEDEEGNPSAQVFRNVIPNQSITGIAVKDNLVYLSGTIRGGLGIEPTETEAKIAVFDTNTNKIVVEAFAPNLPLVGTNSKTIGEISFGPDGLLWGCSEKEGLVFAMNSETFEVVKYVSLSPGDDREALARPLYIRWGNDGLLYTTAGWDVSVINPETMESKRIIGDCSLMSIDNDGNIWYAKGGGFSRIKINQYDRFLWILNDIEKLNSQEYFKEEYDALINECEEAKSIISENTSDEFIIKYIDRIEANKNKLIRKADFMTDYEVFLNYAKQTIGIKGSLPMDNGLAVKITAPDGKTVLLDEFDKGLYNDFRKEYRVDPLQQGTYNIYIYGISMRCKMTEQIEVILPEENLKGDSFLNNVSQVLVGAEVSNYFDKPKTVSIYTALYENVGGKKILYNVERVDKELKAGEHAYIEHEPENAENKIVTVLVWEKDTAFPIAAPKTAVVNSIAEEENK